MLSELVRLLHKQNNHTMTFPSSMLYCLSIGCNANNHLMDDWNRFFLSLICWDFFYFSKKCYIQTIASLSPPVMKWFNFMLVIEIFSLDYNLFDSTGYSEWGVFGCDHHYCGWIWEGRLEVYLTSLALSNKCVKLVPNFLCIFDLYLFFPHSLKILLPGGGRIGDQMMCPTF